MNRTDLDRARRRYFLEYHTRLRKINGEIGCTKSEEHRIIDFVTTTSPVGKSQRLRDQVLILAEIIRAKINTLNRQKSMYIGFIHFMNNRKECDSLETLQMMRREMEDDDATNIARLRRYNRGIQDSKACIYA